MEVQFGAARSARFHHPLPSLDPRDVELALIRSAMELATDYLVLHCAALEQGARSVLIAGRSGAGKTTLSLLLRTRGWRLLSDDLAPFHLPSGTLEPFPRALHLDGIYPPEALSPLPPTPLDFPDEYAPFPDFPGAPQGKAEARRPGLVLLLDRPPPREGDKPGASLHRNQAEGSIPTAEVVQLLHRSVIRTRSFDQERALPLLVELGRGLSGHRIQGASAEETLERACGILDRSQQTPRTSYSA